MDWSDIGQSLSAKLEGVAMPGAVMQAAVPKPQEYEIRLNGRLVKWNSLFLDYGQIMGMLGKAQDDVLSITYSRADGFRESGTMIRGQVIRIRPDGMTIVNAMDTSAA
ncbi:hypothetical protein FRUB_10230 [Fimbriiglobus ruber]|uniref:Uncharacterized protein n=1 Tax=Fimbriiglobus ruber TaxID=1908690 RepID=A0A225DAU7_9BACT|nr:hypothetical protein FRUB_10230 [Fimbriiglobus ruber]